MDSYLQRLQDSITSASSGVSGEELARHSEGKWSIAQVLEHLYLTYTGTMKGCERCLQEGRPLARTPTLRDRARAAVVVELGVLPGGRKAPERATPRGMPAAQVLSAIGPMLAAMDDALARCEARFGKCTRLMDHPILGPLTARQWRKFHWVHGHHHVKQIWRLRAKTEQPNPLLRHRVSDAARLKDKASSNAEGPGRSTTDKASVTVAEARSPVVGVRSQVLGLLPREPN